MIPSSRIPVFCTLLVLVVVHSAGANYLMRFADVHEDKVVFTYEGDLWLVPTAGGQAQRLTRDAGVEEFAKFSPDGRMIAFTANYDGGTDVYVMASNGGEPRRLTYHPAADHVLDWFPDGQRILFRSRREYPYRAEQIYSVDLGGRLPERLPVDRAGLTAVSPDGTRIAYNRISREFRTWKRYQGGMAQDIWMGSLLNKDYKRITDWPGTDSFPMWQDDAIYFISDREHGRLNIYKYDLNSGQASAMTEYTDYDVKFPSIGPGMIVYQYGERLHLLSLKSGRTQELDVRIMTEQIPVREGLVEPEKYLGSFGVSPTGKRVVVESRGEILNLAAEAGEPINLSMTSGSREKNPAWSPDGRWIAFISDRTGEEELYLVDQKAKKPWRQLTKGGQGFRLQPVWSPDSRWLLFSDKSMKLNLLDAQSGELSVLDQAECDDGWERWGIQDYVWSPDNRWIAYTKMGLNVNESIHLYSMEQKKSYPVTDGMSTSFSPSFDPKGRYLYYLSHRTFEPIMCMIDQTNAYLDVCRPYVVMLSADTPSPFAPREVLEEEKDEKETGAGKDGNGDGDEDGQDVPATRIDVDGLMLRTVAAEGVPAGNYFRLEATPDGFCFLKKTKPEFLKYQNVSDTTDVVMELHHYAIDEKKPEDRKSKKLMDGVNNYHVSADGKKIVYKAGRTIGVVDAGKEAKGGDGKVDLAQAKFPIDRRKELMQVFNEAWRVQRDWFYDPALHGVNWDAVGEKYRKFVRYCGNRSDLTYLIGEMIGELNAGHTYSSGGERRETPVSVSTGMLGADFEAVEGAPYLRVSHIVPGTSWDESEYSPLGAPGCPIRAGHYIIAVDGVEARANVNIHRHLQNKAGRVVELTYNDQPTPDGAKTYLVRAIGSEERIRYREWVESRRAYVEKKTGGEVGYLHIPDMMQRGLIEFARGYYPQHNKKALIIDERYNGGGFVGDMIIDRLERRVWSLTKPREGGVLRNPERAFHGPLAVIINEDTGSNGEYFAEALKIGRLATLIGKRTWGGAIGIEPHQILVDGGTTTPPQFAPFGLDRKWLIEGHGVEPDLDVQNMPGDVLRGIDAQLDAAIEHVMKEAAEGKYEIPPAPEYPRKD